MPSKISISHAMEACEWFESIFGKQESPALNAFTRGLDDGYNQQEPWVHDPEKAQIPYMKDDMSFRGHGLRVGAMACRFDQLGFGDQPLLLSALYSGPSPGDFGT